MRVLPRPMRDSWQVCYCIVLIITGDNFGEVVEITIID